MHHVALNPDNFSIAIFNLTVSERIHLAYVVRHQHSPHIFAMWLDRGIATIRLKYEGICVITTAHRQFETCISDCATGIAVYSVTIAILAKMNRDCIIFRALDGQCQLTERRFSEVSKNTVFIIDDRDRFLIFFTSGILVYSASHCRAVRKDCGSAYADTLPSRATTLTVQ